MSTECVMCGRTIAEGEFCEGCTGARGDGPGAERMDESFPKAPIVPFPLEATSLALTSIHEILTSADVPGILLGSDGRVRYASDDAKRILGLAAAKPIETEQVVAALQLEMPPPRESVSRQVTVGGSRVDLSLIPLSGGAAGTVLILRDAGRTQLDPALAESLREIRNELGGIAQVPRALIRRLGDVIDRMTGRGGPANPESIRQLYEKVVSEFSADAEERRIRMQVDAPELGESWSDTQGLLSALRVLIRNSLHYVPRGGQIVLGLRLLEHRGEPSLLFFVMDNGPVVPEELREQIFADGFSWTGKAGPRSGFDLATCRHFAAAHGGQAWVESRTGKACTFFMRVPLQAAEQARRQRG